jgi:hypothetical protein
MSFSNYLENEILDHILGNASWSAPATTYVALFTAFTEGGVQTEVTGGSYARVAVTNNATNWPAAASGAKSNGISVDFPTATVSWGTVTHFGVFDALTSGNLLCWGALTASKTIDVDDTPKFAIGDLDVTLD